MSTLGETIRKLRKEKCLTQRELAAHVGINATYLSKIENDRLMGNQSPKEQTLQRFAQVLDTDLEVLCLLAGKIPHSITQRILNNSDLFARSAWLDDEAFLGLIRGLSGKGDQDVVDLLARANNFLQGVLDALTTQLCVLDESGRIVAVNEAWSAFARKHSLSIEKCGPGIDYLAVCDAATDDSREEARSVSVAIREILAGKRTNYDLEYPCHTPTMELWFLMRISRFEFSEKVRVVVSHDDITSRKIAELAMEKARESKFEI